MSRRTKVSVPLSKPSSPNSGHLDVLVNNARCRCHPFCARFLRLPVYVRHSVRHERDICRDHDAALPTTTAQISVWHYHQRLVRKGFVGDFVFREDAAPPVSIPYSVSKTALNALTLEMAKLPENEGGAVSRYRAGAL
jgi:NAD(P)-dependent dehydrogenase (short-subunit alcohol dehydrogenase family)